MSDVKHAAWILLTDDAAVAALVSSRVYRTVAEEDATLPYIVINRIATRRVRGSLRTTGKAQPLLQLDCWADTEAGAHTLADAVREALDTFSGTVTAAGFSLELQDVILENEFDDYEASKTGRGLGRFAKRMDFRVWHTESVPTP